MRLVLAVSKGDYLRHHRSHVVDFERVHACILCECSLEHIHRDREIVLHVKCIDGRAHLVVVPPVDDHLD